ncbi:MAG: zf-TFIIB domain-containing protein [Proteobacteria bacterium]|nr:zf-TFIIB domain-containing protein [Pseudomonadota bacterium]
MAIFGEKCARCGTRTRNEVEGAATCETCEQEMQLLVAARGEDKRPCPVDGTTMVKEIAHMLVIDRCPSCKGVWLDGGELERLKGGVESRALMAMTSGFTVPFN